MVSSGQGMVDEGAEWIGGEAAGEEDGQGAEHRGTHHGVGTGHPEVFPTGTAKVGGELEVADNPSVGPNPRLPRKRKSVSLDAPSNETILSMCQQKKEGDRAAEATKRAEIEQRAVRPRSTTSTYASHAKKYVVFRVGRMCTEGEDADMFMERLTPEERTKEWVQYIYHLSASGVIGRPLASHLSGTKAFFRENSEVDLSFCSDDLEQIKAAKIRANGANREFLRSVALKKDASVKLPVFQELTSLVYKMAFQDIDDWGWHPTHQKGAATAQLLQTITGVRISNSVRRSLTDHHLNTEDVIIRFERAIRDGAGGPRTWVLTCGDEWDPTFEPSDVHSVEVREQTGKGKVEYKSRHISRVDELSDHVCLAVAYWAKNSGAQTGEPFFTMRRRSMNTNKVTVCCINISHVNFVIKDAADALALGRSHYSSHSARSGFVTKHSWAEKQAEKVRGQGAGASGSELAQMGGWKNDSMKGVMRMHYDRTTSVYRPISPDYELSREDVVGMLSLVEQDKLPRLTLEEQQELRAFRRTVWGTASVKNREKGKAT